MFTALKNFIYWGWKLRNYHWWDPARLYYMIYLHLSSLEEKVENKKVSPEFSDKKLRKLKEARYIAYKQAFFDYDSHYCALIEKWGKSSIVFDNSRCVLKDPEKVNESNEKQYRKDCGVAVYRDMQQEKREHSRLFKILDKQLNCYRG